MMRVIVVMIAMIIGDYDSDISDDDGDDSDDESDDSDDVDYSTQSQLAYL
jgi:hypothetical protein